jgi:hypothetical protein
MRPREEMTGVRTCRDLLPQQRSRRRSLGHLGSAFSLTPLPASRDAGAESYQRKTDFSLEL